MKKLVLIALVAGIATSCNSQDKSKTDLAQHEPKVEKPKGNWTVNKEVDENGNVVKYDSIYSYSSKDNFKGIDSEDMDSLRNGFTQKFEKHFYSSSDGTMPDAFADGSLFEDEMFKDFFENDMENSSEIMKKMRARMEAMRSQMQQGTAVIPALPSKDNKNSNK